MKVMINTKGQFHAFFVEKLNKTETTWSLGLFINLNEISKLKDKTIKKKRRVKKERKVSYHYLTSDYLSELTEVILKLFPSNFLWNSTHKDFSLGLNWRNNFMFPQSCFHLDLNNDEQKKKKNEKAEIPSLPIFHLLYNAIAICLNNNCLKKPWIQIL